MAIEESMTPEGYQRAHYTATAATYDEELGSTPEHELALHYLVGVLGAMEACSLLDVGAGTGRGMRFLNNRLPSLQVTGVEPVAALREIAIGKGIAPDRILEASGDRLPFEDGAFDVVAEFGVLHHVKKPETVVSEMLRVAKLGVFISDTNNLGQGGLVGRLIKNLAFWSGLWRPFNFLRTKGKGYVIEPNDGLWYYYTPMQHYGELTAHCHSIHILNTRRSGRTPWFSASHVAILATKAALHERVPFFGHLK